MAVDPQAPLRRSITSAAAAMPAPRPPTSSALISPSSPCFARVSMFARGKVPVLSTSAACGVTVSSMTALSDAECAYAIPLLVPLASGLSRSPPSAGHWPVGGREPARSHDRIDQSSSRGPGDDATLGRAAVESAGGWGHYLAAYETWLAA